MCAVKQATLGLVRTPQSHCRFCQSLSLGLGLGLTSPPGSQRLGLPRHLLVPGSREESTTEVEQEEETEREEEEEEVTLICNPEVLRLKEEVEDSRRRLKECKVTHCSSQPYSFHWPRSSILEKHKMHKIAQALIQKLSVDNLRMTGRELSFRTQLEAIATRRRGDSTTLPGKESTKSTLSSKEASSRVFRG